MTRYRCEKCGERFNSEYNLKLHKDLTDCAPKESESETNTSAGEEEKHQSMVSEATGTLRTYHEDRGFGFAVTADITNEGSREAEHTRNVFVHISDVDVGKLSEGDRLEFEIVKTKDGLKAENATVIQRASERDDYADPRSDPAKRHGFGHQKDDGRYGRKTEPSDRDLEDFADERKFR
jgi:cold shock CspA family protein